MYDFKRGWEIAWIAAVAAGVFALEMLVRFDPDAVTDWRTWGIALGGGMIRAAAGAVLGILTRPKT